MTEMKGTALAFAQLESTDNLHSRVTRALALQVIRAERNGTAIAFPNEGGVVQAAGRQPQHSARSGQGSG